MPSRSNPIDFNARWLLTIISLLLLMGLALWLTATWTRQAAFNNLETQATDALQVYAGSLTSELEKFQALPKLLSHHQAFKDLLQQPDDAQLLDRVNRELVEFNSISSTLTTYLINKQGRVIASSNWNQPDSFIDENLSFRPYFKDAIRFGNDAYFAVGTTSRKRGYYFSSAIEMNQRRTGVIVIKVDLDNLEANWRAGNHEVAVTDRDGVIFLSSREDWLYRSLYPMSEERRQQVQESRRYVDAPIDPLPITARTKLEEFQQIIDLSNEQGGNRRLLQLARNMPSESWSIHIMSNMATIDRQVTQSIFTVGLFLLLCAAAFKLIQSRLQIRSQKVQLEKEAFDNLELQVQQRTKELTSEIKERKQTELELQETQGALVQSAKMAALGQMATSITHELNQPLGAIRNFSDNAQTMLKREQIANVDSNLKLISRMTERMNDIMQHLKAFARKTPLSLETVSIHQVLAETLLVLGPALKRADVTVNYLRADDSLRVVAEPNRLQQVCTNLLQNAIDSMKHSDNRIVTLRTTRDNKTKSVCVIVSDTGIGIDTETAEKLFEPFFSTKSAGEGLGLGLSISYGIMRDLGGDISVTPSPEGGASFKLTLKEAVQKETEAA